ncbi:single-stranded DNA-binding protein [Helcococcus bovis]|uniref:single-stranded DNA-binding protein n=1 Tax=Helcococcus bovis TaxID=3153252 RepID=UPI0038BCA610
MNNVILMGRLTKTPELRYLQGSNKAYVRINIACEKNLSKEKKQELEAKGTATADFINCVGWGTLAENIAKFVDKGSRIIINGSIQTGSYEKDGQKIYTTDVLIHNSEFIDWKNNNNGIDQTQGYKDDHNQTDSFEYTAEYNPVDDNRIPF